MPVLHHLRPLSTTSSPSSTAVACMFVASEEATSGSVMQNAERILPSSSGPSQRALLLVGAEVQQHLHVAGVGRVAVEDLARDQRTAHPLGQRRVLDVRQPRADRLAVELAPGGRNRFHSPCSRAQSLELLDRRRRPPPRGRRWRAPRGGRPPRAGRSPARETRSNAPAARACGGSGRSPSRSASARQPGARRGRPCRWRGARRSRAAPLRRARAESARRRSGATWPASISGSSARPISRQSSGRAIA